MIPADRENHNLGFGLIVFAGGTTMLVSETRWLEVTGYSLIAFIALYLITRADWPS